MTQTVRGRTRTIREVRPDSDWQRIGGQATFQTVKRGRAPFLKAASGHSKAEVVVFVLASPGSPTVTGSRAMSSRRARSHATIGSALNVNCVTM